MDEIPKVILIIETSRNFGRQILLGVAKYARLYGPWAFYREPGGLHASLPHLSNWKADGIIMRNSKACKKLLALKVPTILVVHDTETFPILPSIMTNSAAITKMAVDHLVEKGLTNFAYCGNDNYPWSIERQKYFENYISGKNFVVNIYHQPKSHSKRKWESEQVYMANWLRDLPKPVGIMTCNDDRGQHVIEACKIANLNVPDEVSVIGVDNDSLLCDLCDPPLTSIALDTEAAGYLAAEMLDKLMKKKKLRKKEIIISPTYVVCRQSTDKSAIDDPDLIEALRYIRQNAKSKIKVVDVVNKTLLSRRSLELRFRRLIHRSIQEEIRKVRVDLITRMLIETNLPISEITNVFSFTDQEHISRYFKKEKSVGLRDFRRLHQK